MGGSKKEHQLPVFRFDRTPGITRNLQAFLNPEGGITRGVVPDVEQHEVRSEDPKNVQATHG
jgi:hypothetical protein